MLKKLVCILVIGLLVVGFLGGVTQAKDTMTPVIKKSLNPTTKYTPHAPIRINSDADFTSQFSNRTIWGLEINGTGYPADCIFIGNCSLPFTIKNCYLHTTGYNRNGLTIQNSSNAFIINNICFSKHNNVYLYYSNNITLSENNCSNAASLCVELSHSNDNRILNNTCNGNNISSTGIELSYSNRNLMMNNTCNYNAEYGIYVYHSDCNSLINNLCSYTGLHTTGWGIGVEKSNLNTFIGNNCSFETVGITLYNSRTNTLKQNIFIKCGIFINGNMLDFNSQIIDDTNLVNNKPEYYLKNDTGKTVSSGRGQIILANCSHIAIIGQVISNVSEGIVSGFSNNCTFTHNILTGNYGSGIVLINCNENILTFNQFKNDGGGINLQHSNLNTIKFNNCSGNSWGITVAGGYNIIKNNNCTGNSNEGIALNEVVASDINNILVYNNCSRNINNGISIRASYNVVISNILQENAKYGIYIDHTGAYATKNRIYYNNFISNNVGKKQAYDPDVNFWNTSGTPHGYGNYWSDWSGPDNNSDGIVDFPYHLDGGAGATDYYPLTTPVIVPETPLPASLLILSVLLITAIATRRTHFKTNKK